jgi:hypothetical protein
MKLASMSNVHFLEGQHQLLRRNLTHVLLSFFAMNSAVDRNKPVVKEEVLRRLKFFVNTVQAREQNASMKSQCSQWPLKGHGHDIERSVGQQR